MLLYRVCRDHDREFSLSLPITPEAATEAAAAELYCARGEEGSLRGVGPPTTKATAVTEGYTAKEGGREGGLPATVAGALLAVWHTPKRKRGPKAARARLVG